MQAKTILFRSFIFFVYQIDFQYIKHYKERSFINLLRYKQIKRAKNNEESHQVINISYWVLVNYNYTSNDLY